MQKSYIKCCRSKTKFLQDGFFRLTIVRCQGDERDELGEDALADDGAGNKAGVVSRVLSFHLGDVQVPRPLGDEAPAIGLQENRELVVDPAVGHLLCGKKKTDAACKSRSPRKHDVTGEEDREAATYVARLLAGRTAKQLPGLL